MVFSSSHMSIVKLHCTKNKVAAKVVLGTENNNVVNRFWVYDLSFFLSSEKTFCTLYITALSSQVLILLGHQDLIEREDIIDEVIGSKFCIKVFCTG